MRPVDLAEQALAGALLLDPACVREVAWLQPEDFTDAGCAAVYRVASDRAACPDAVDAGVLRRDLDALPGLHPHHRSPARLHEFMLSCPLHPQLTLYGRMVLEGAIRRQVQLLGLRVEASTLVEAPPQGPVPLAHAVTETLAHVLSLHTRWQAAIGKGEAGPRSTEQQVSLLRVAEAAGDRYLVHTAAPDEASVTRAERAVLQEILLRPALLDRLAPRLRREDFLDTECATTYAVMLSLHERGSGSRVDAVSVAWQQQRLDAPGLSAAELRRLAYSTGSGFVEGDVELVLRAALHRLAQEARAGVQNAGRDPTLDPADLLHTAAGSYESVRATAIRMAGLATGDGERPQPRGLLWRPVRPAVLSEPRPPARLPPAV